MIDADNILQHLPESSKDHLPTNLPAFLKNPKSALDTIYLTIAHGTRLTFSSRLLRSCSSSLWVSTNSALRFSSKVRYRISFEMYILTIQNYHECECVTCWALRLASSSSSMTSKRACSTVLPTRTSRMGFTSTLKSNNYTNLKSNKINSATLKTNKQTYISIFYLRGCISAYFGRNEQWCGRAVQECIRLGFDIGFFNTICREMIGGLKIRTT